MLDLVHLAEITGPQPTPKTEFNSPFRDVMLDLETLGTRSSAVIIQMSLIPFDRSTGILGPTFVAFPAQQEQLDLGRTVDASTISFWLSQTKVAQDRVNRPHSVLRGLYILSRLQAFLNKYMANEYGVWSHKEFDYPIISSYASDLGIPKLFHYRSPRDLRTLSDTYQYVTGEPLGLTFTGVQHDAMDDCLHQIKLVVHAFNTIGSSEEPSS